SRLDWSKPLLSQLSKIAPHYQKWVNSAVYRKCRLFESPLLEGLTYTPWYLVPMFWIPVIIYLTVTQCFSHVYCGDVCTSPITEVEFVFHMAIGFMVWTFLEYSLHRWVFHYDPGSSIKLIQLHFLIHGMHHKLKYDSTSDLKSLEDTQNKLLTECSVLDLKLKDLETKTNEAKEELLDLQAEVNNQHHWARITNIEVTALPALHRESPIDLVIGIANFAGVILTRDQVEFATRVQPQKPNPNRPKSLIAKPKNRDVKDSILSELRKLKGINTKNRDVEGASKKGFCE
ncbi:putative fatty acid hydroxylase, partial [Danaus plexippus plexippus]